MSKLTTSSDIGAFLASAQGLVQLQNVENISLNNGSLLRKGTHNNGGNNGIALECTVGYELKWEAGRLFALDSTNYIRVEQFSFYVPTQNDDITQRYLIGSLRVLDNGETYICRDNTEGAAIWELIPLDSRISSDLVKPTDLFSLRKSNNINIEFWRKRYIKAITTRSDLPTASIKTSTGYARALRWDGTLGPVSGIGIAGGFFSVNFGSALVSPYNTTIPKFFAIYPCSSNGSLSGNITEIILSNNSLTYVDMTNLEYLTYVNLNNNDITAFDTTGLSALNNLDVSNNRIKTLRLSNSIPVGLTLNVTFNYEILLTGNLSSIVTLNNQANDIRHIDLSLYNNLQSLELSSNQLMEVDLSSNTALTNLSLADSPLSSIDVSNNLALTTLQLVNIATISSIDVSLNTGLESLILQNITNLSSLNIGYTLPNLINFECIGSEITSLDVTGCTNLNLLTCQENPSLTQLNANGLIYLDNISCDNNSLTSLNVVGCSNLKTLTATNNQLTNLDLTGIAVSSSPGGGGTIVYLSYNQFDYQDINTLLSTLEDSYVNAPAPTIYYAVNELYITDNPGSTDPLVDPSLASGSWTVYLE